MKITDEQLGRWTDELLALRRESRAVRELALPNEPDDSLEELLKELKAWDAHSDANLRNLDRISTLEKELERLRKIETAARTLADKLDFVHGDPRYQSVWQLYALHGGEYTEPKYEVEFVALRATMEGK